MNSNGFWYGLNPSQLIGLQNASNGFIGFTCGTPEVVFLMPINVIAPLVLHLNTTLEEDNPNEIRHWHIVIEKHEDSFYFLLPKAESNLKIDEYLI